MGEKTIHRLPYFEFHGIHKMEVTGRFQGVILMTPETSVEYGLEYKLQILQNHYCNYFEPLTFLLTISLLLLS